MTTSGRDMAAALLTNQRGRRARVPRPDATTSPRHSDHPRTGHHGGTVHDSASPCPARHGHHLRKGHNGGATRDLGEVPSEHRITEYSHRPPIIDKRCGHRGSTPPCPPWRADHPRTGHHSGLTSDSASPCPVRHDDHLRTGHDGGGTRESAPPCPPRRGDHLRTGPHGGLTRECRLHVPPGTMATCERDTTAASPANQRHHVPSTP